MAIDIFQKTWTIFPDKKIFFEPVSIQFYMHNNELRGRKIKKKKQAVIVTKHRVKNTDNNIIWNLYWKNGEYLYGWFSIAASRGVYRCKLWQKEKKIFLRIYTEPIYSTYILNTITP